MALDDPAHVAGLRGAQEVGPVVLGRRREQRFDGVHRLDETRPGVHREPLEHRADLRAGAGVQPGEGGRAARRKPQQGLAAVRVGGSLLDQPALTEGPEDAAQVAGVEPQLLAQVRRRGLLDVRELVERARCGQGKRTGEEMLLQDADLARVETIEPAHRLHAPRNFPGNHRDPSRAIDSCLCTVFS